jgi:membrane-associated phospholipid phosphatase
MFARIYFFCHYFADTLVGAFIGIAVGIASLRIPLNI